MAQALSNRIDDWLRQGLALHQSGKFDDAEPLYRRVLARQPSHPAANHLLGLIKLQQGQAEKAVALISRAVHLRGTDPQYHCNLGVALNASGQPERAIASFERAIELQPGYADAFSNRGMALKALGRLTEAVESYQRAVALKPAEAGYHLNLANAQVDLGDRAAAEQSYRRALALRPGYPAALSGLCLTLEYLDRAGEAVAAGEAAVAAWPREPEHHKSLGRAYRAAMRPEDAVASYRRALALDPRDAESFRLMSLILRRAASDDDMGAMEALLQEPGLPNEQQAQLHFALGKGYDDLGDYRRALDHYLRGNALQRRNTPFSIQAVEHEFAVLERLFETSRQPLPSLPHGQAGPIFIVGLPRSGKSSLEGMLGWHARTHKGGELPLLGHQVDAVMRQYRLAEPSVFLDALPPSVFATIGANYRREAEKLAGRSAVLIDTMPLNFCRVGFIRLAMPGARILHCIRDPLEHCVAMFQKYFARHGYEYASDPDELAAYYRLYRRLMAHWHRLFPDFVLDIDMAALRQQPEAQMRKVLEFCGLEWDAACLEPYEPEPQIGRSAPISAEQRRQRLELYGKMVNGGVVNDEW